MKENNFDTKLYEEIETISVEARSKGFGESRSIIYKTKFTFIIVFAFHIPRADGTIHHFVLRINKYQRKKTTDPWLSVMDEVKQDETWDFQSLKIDSKDGEAVRKLTEFLNAQYKVIGQKINQNKVIIDNPDEIDLPAFINSLTPAKIKNIDSLVSVSRLKSILTIWEVNKENDNEEFWQGLFQEHAWILSQIFACPFVQIGEKFYCGGKEDDDKGGVKGDFLYSNNLTKNLSFVEIKTPQTKIIGSKYRGKEGGKVNVIYCMSDDLTGGINQVLNQRKIYSTTFGNNKSDRLYNAKCVLVIGREDKLQNQDEVKSFELFRSSSRNVEIITFDELFGKVQAFINLLKD
jgi:hypothetical protein